MGASFDWVRINVGPYEIQRLEAAFAAVQKEAAYERGHSYSGCLNMCNGLKVDQSNPFATDAQAVEWIEEHTEKWENALAVWVSESGPEKKDGHWVVGGWCAS